MKSKLEAWAENLQKEVYSEYIEKYFSWKPGLKVFYSPVAMNPHLMIISYQPGGTEKISVNKKLKEKLTLLKKGLMQDLLSGNKRVNI